MPSGCEQRRGDPGRGMGEERAFVQRKLGGHPVDKGERGATCWAKLTSPWSATAQDARTQLEGVTSVEVGLGRQAG